MQLWRHKCKSRNADFIFIARRAILSPLNLLNLLNPLNLFHAPPSVSEHNPSTQPAAAGGHNLQPRRGWPPLNPHAAGVSIAAHGKSV